MGIETIILDGTNANYSNNGAVEPKAAKQETEQGSIFPLVQKQEVLPTLVEGFTTAADEAANAKAKTANDFFQNLFGFDMKPMLFSGILGFLLAQLISLLTSQVPGGDTPVEQGDDTPVEDEPVEDEPVDEEPIDEEPVDEEPVDEEPADGDNGDNNGGGKGNITIIINQ